MEGVLRREGDATVSAFSSFWSANRKEKYDHANKCLTVCVTVEEVGEEAQGVKGAKGAKGAQ